MLWWLFECLQEVQHVPDINMVLFFDWGFMVIFRQISPLPSYCDPVYVLVIFQDFLGFSGSARVFLSPCLPLVTVWFLTMI